MSTRALRIRYSVNWEMVLLWASMILFGFTEACFAVYGFIQFVRLHIEAGETFLSRLEQLL